MVIIYILFYKRFKAFKTYNSIIFSVYDSHLIYFEGIPQQEFLALNKYSKSSSLKIFSMD